VGEAVGLAAGAVESKETGVSGFAGGLILADAFAEFFLGGDNIEDVVNDLEGEAKGPAELGEVGKSARIGPGRHGAKAEGSGNEGAGFGTVNLNEFFQRDAFLFRIEIQDLARDEAEAAGGVGKLSDEVGPGVAAIGLGAGDRGKGLGQEAVSGENGDGFAEYLVVGGSATAEIVVIHTGQVVMDEGIGVDTLDGTGGGQGGDFVATGGPGGGEAKNGAQAFATG